MNNLPHLPPHVVADMLGKLAREHGYFFRELHMVYYDGIDEYLTKISCLETYPVDETEV